MIAHVLFPAPREVSLAAGGGRVVELEAVPDGSLPPQGYELVIGASGTRIRHADDLGLRYARRTLAQLAAAGDVGTGRIRDWPDFAHRGVMLDVSRDRVPTMPTLEWLVGRLAELRYNHLQLYVEHTFAYADHETVWRGASPITPDELRHLDDCCHEHGIELAANQNTFGHMERWLRHPEYHDRAECPDGSEEPRLRWKLPPWSLEPTPENAAFARELVRQMASNLRSRRVNIGADEPFDLGKGKSAQVVARRGKPAVYLEHLRSLIDPLLDEGYDVQFWGDGFTRHPELVPELPRRGATAIAWSYEAPDPDGTGLDELLGPDLSELLGIPERANLGFASYVASYAAAGYPMWVAPGTSTWLSLLGRWTNARGNLRDAAAVGRDVGATGYLVTDWGDHGHAEPLPVSMLALAYGAGVAWCHRTNQDLDVTGVVDELLDAHAGVGARLAELGELYHGVGTKAANGSPLAVVMLDGPTVPPLWGRLDVAGTERAEQVIDTAIEAFASVPFAGPRARTTADELVAVCRLARHGLRRLRDRFGDEPVDREALARDFAEAIALQRDAWLTTSRPGGLEDSLSRLVPP